MKQIIMDLCIAWLLLFLVMTYLSPDYLKNTRQKEALEIFEDDVENGRTLASGYWLKEKDFENEVSQWVGSVSDFSRNAISHTVYFFSDLFFGLLEE